MRKLFILFVVVFLCSPFIAPQPTSAAYDHGWIAQDKTSLRECHARTCKRLIHIQEGQRVAVTKYWDNWGYVVVGEGEVSGWVNLLVFKRDARADKMKRCYNTTFGYTACASDWISEAITAAAKKYNIPRNLMMQVAACESDFKPIALGALGEIGIFQWMPSTWNTSSVVGDIHDSWDQSMMAAKYMSLGYEEWWTCWRRIVQGER